MMHGDSYCHRTWYGVRLRGFRKTFDGLRKFLPRVVGDWLFKDNNLVAQQRTLSQSNQQVGT